MLIGEAKRARNDVTTDVYYSLIVGKHKTGHIFSATLFIYPEMYCALNVFTTVIIPKLSIYCLSASLTKKCHVFQTFSRRELLSSRVTPILRQVLQRAAF